MATQRARLIDQESPGNFLRFHYNPSKYDEKETPEYEESKVAGSIRPNVQWKAGGDRIISFELFLNDFGQKETAHINKKTDEALTWIKEMMRPRGISSEPKKYRPRKMLLTRGSRPVFVCYIADFGSSEELFEPGTHKPLRARVKLVLKEYIDPPEENSSPNSPGAVSKTKQVNQADVGKRKAYEVLGEKLPTNSGKTR